jgi:hypothetical protein
MHIESFLWPDFVQAIFTDVSYWRLLGTEVREGPKSVDDETSVL